MTNAANFAAGWMVLSTGVAFLNGWVPGPDGSSAFDALDVQYWDASLPDVVMAQAVLLRDVVMAQAALLRDVVMVQAVSLPGVATAQDALPPDAKASG